MVVAAVQHEIVVLGPAGTGEHLVGQFHAVAQHQPMHIFGAVLPGQTLLAQDAPHQRLYPHLGFAAPFHQGSAAVVGDKNAGGRKKHPCEPGASHLRGVDPHFLDFTGTVKGGILDGFAVIALRRKDLRLFILKEPDPRIVHRDIGFREAVEPEPPVHLALEAVGVGVAGQVGRETLRPAVQQGGLGLCPQPIAPEPVAVVGPQQPALFERGHDRLQIVGAGRETVQLAGWELSRDGGQR